MQNIIEIKNLKKTFVSGKTEIVAVNGINLIVHRGEIFGLLGPNGAGKTTTMRILTTLSKPTSGSINIAGFDLATQSDSVRNAIGYVSQSGGLERSASGRENLVLQARLYGMSKSEAQTRASELINSLGMTAFADRRVETYSGGQRRKTDIALGMVNKPEILFLDEPTIALDPQSRAQIWQEIKKLKTRGTTVFFTTHYLDEADQFCDRVAIVDNGKIVALGAPATLKQEIKHDNRPTTLDDVFLQKTGHKFTQDN